jgi:hypothetical protein
MFWNIRSLAVKWIRVGAALALGWPTLSGAKCAARLAKESRAVSWTLKFSSPCSSTSIRVSELQKEHQHISPPLVLTSYSEDTKMLSAPLAPVPIKFTAQPVVSKCNQSRK